MKRVIRSSSIIYDIMSDSSRIFLKVWTIKGMKIGKYWEKNSSIIIYLIFMCEKNEDRRVTPKSQRNWIRIQFSQ